MVNNAIVTRGLRVRRGRATVIDGLDLEVPQGAIVGLLGPSGSGKTTLMRAIVGVQIIAGGSVRVLGESAGSAPLRRRVGYMTQAASIYDDLSVRDNLRYFARVQSAPMADVDRVLERTDLMGQADQLARTPSGGQANRVSLAAAMLGSPELLVLDEPTVGLDPVLRADLWEIFRRLADDGTTLVVSSHVMDEATRCDRLLLMREGAVIADTTPEELLTSTGAASAEEAFLRIIEQDSQGTRSGPTHLLSWKAGLLSRSPGPRKGGRRSGRCEPLPPRAGCCIRSATTRARSSCCSSCRACSSGWWRGSSMRPTSSRASGRRCSRSSPSPSCSSSRASRPCANAAAELLRGCCRRRWDAVTSSSATPWPSACWRSCRRPWPSPTRRWCAG